MNQKSILIIVLVLIVSNAVCVYQFWRYKDVFSNKLSLVEERMVDQKNEVAGLRSYSYSLITTLVKYQDAYLDASTPLVDIDKGTTTLREVMRFGNKLVYRWTDKACEMCYDGILPKIKEFGEAVGNENIIVLVPLSHLRKTYVTFNENGIHLTLLAIRENSTIGLPDLESNYYPFFFLLSSDMKASSVFIPSKTSIEMTETYLHSIANRFVLK